MQLVGPLLTETTTFRVRRRAQLSYSRWTPAGPLPWALLRLLSSVTVRPKRPGANYFNEKPIPLFPHKLPPTSRCTPLSLSLSLSIMTLSVDVSSTVQLQEESPLSMAASPPLVSPSSDRRFWSTLRNRVDALLESRNFDQPSSISPFSDQRSSRAKRMKEDSMLLIRGFDSIAYSLSQLTSTLDNALQGARDLAKPPSLTEMVQSSTSNTETVKDKEAVESERAEHSGGQREKVKKRKLDVRKCSKDEVVVAATDKETQAENSLKKVKSLAVSMAAKSASLARELKSIKSDLCFMRERCALLEEENRRLRDGFGKDIRPDEDDLVRLQLEALLAEKSRLAAENANLTRENQCLRQLVEYHQFTSQDLSASYEQVIQGLCLGFSSPVAEQECGFGDPETPKTTGSFEFRTDLDGSFAKEQQEHFKD